MVAGRRFKSTGESTDIPYVSDFAVRVVEEAVRLVSAQRRPVQRWRGAAVVVGILAELVVLTPFSVFGTPSQFVGSLGALPVAVACVTGFVAGPAAAVIAALSGWTFFFALLAQWDPAGLLALPLWMGPAAVVGMLAERVRARDRQLALLEAERRYEAARRELENVAQHTVRTPAAVIRGMADVLLRDHRDFSAEQTRAFIELIADSAQELLDAPELQDAAKAKVSSLPRRTRARQAS